MSATPRYALDANVFIEAKRRYYAFDICPGFWSVLLWQEARGQVVSVDRVKAELERGADDLWDWASRVMPPSCFASTDAPAVLDVYGQIVAWVEAQPQFRPEAKTEFLASADGWLIAYAKANGLVLVTHEQPAPAARQTVPIPNVCSAFQVLFVDTFEMLRALATQFSWSPVE
jgi:hypothetical protein